MLTKIKSLSLTLRIVVTTLVIIGVVMAVNNTVFVNGYTESAEQALVDKAAAFTAVADEAKNHTANLQSLNTFHMEELLTDLKTTLDAGKSYKEARIFGTIPVVAGWTAAEKAASRENINFRVSSFEARNKDNEPAPGSFENDLLKKLTRQVDSGESEVAYAINRETNELHYMRAITLSAGCMMCHGKPGNKFDADGDGKDVLGFQMESWEIGYMHGAYHVVLPLEPVDAQVASFISNGLLWTIPLVLFGLGSFVFLMNVMFAKPIKNLIARVRDIAEGEGDLTQRIDIKSQDELGKLGTWFNAFIQRVHDIILEVSNTANEVASAATQISASSEEMAVGMTEQTQQVAQISSAIEEMSASVSEVASKSNSASESATKAGDTASQGGQAVSDTISGMEAINDAVKASSVSVQELGKRGEQIGEIISVINDIADQTNLLALNAAIEAARAGEHGRGFAVVADEVRKLADRTTKATEEIGESIQAIQSETAQAVERMSVGTEQVARGVDLATGAGENLQEIVTNSQEVASMIQSIAAAAEQQSETSNEVSRNVESISAVSRQASEGAGQAASASSQLSIKAEQLQALVGQFKTDQTSTAHNTPTRNTNAPTQNGPPASNNDGWSNCDAA